MEVSDVIRGEDHISNTPRQLLLYEALGFAPPRFAHLAMVMGPDHSPLSKRHGATSVAEFRSKGYLPEALVNYLALIGLVARRWRRAAADRRARAPLFRRQRRHSAGVFDEEKLAWVNRHYLKVADPARLAQLSLPCFHACRHAHVARRSGRGVSGVGDVDGERIGRSTEPDSGAARVSIRLLGRSGARGSGGSWGDDDGSSARRRARARRTSSRRRRGSIASDSGRWRIR